MIKNLVFVFLLLASFAISAQRTSSSPYSFFGIGEEFTPNTIEQSAMGGIGVAFSHYKYLNFLNPAAYADLRYTTYSFGILNSNLTLKNGATKQTGNTTSLSYFALAFPIGKKMGASVGLQPLSSIGYSLNNSITDSNGDITRLTSFTGSGGVSRVYLSFGLKLTKEITFGLEASSSFGNVENSVSEQIANVSLASKYNEKLKVRGGSLKLGTQFNKQLKNKTTISAGATVKLGHDLRITGNEYLYSLTFTSDRSEISRDTISQTTITGRYNLPVKTTLGFGLGKFYKWYVGLEYEGQAAIGTSGFLSTSNAAFRYGDSNRFSLGGFYIPKINSISSYFDRITYRAGLRFEKTGLLINGSGSNANFTEVDDFGMSFGLGIPLKQLSTLNMGFEFGKRGTTSNNLIQENYFNFRLGLSLTDINWFQKRKID